MHNKTIPLKREIIITADGSSTIQIPELNEQYHSVHGAIQESMHVFINSGLKKMIKKEINILEIGFGTGLNCFLTLLEALKLNINIEYTGVEAFPVENDEISRLNYVSELNAEKFSDCFVEIHRNNWNRKIEIAANFILEKQKKFFDEISDKNYFDLIYFDAFGARVQPELWTEEIFKKMYEACKNNAILVTYSSKGSVRRAMQDVGFSVEKIPGPPGKREMLRAFKKIK